MNFLYVRNINDTIIFSRLDEWSTFRLFDTAFFCWRHHFPFNMIHAKARKIDSQNPQEAANGYKNSDNTSFFGYEEIN